jgi:hypothetical protein
VLVRHVDTLNLRKVYADLSEAGLQRRLAWVVENVIVAIDQVIDAQALRAWVLLCRRAQVVFNVFLAALPGPSGSRPDVLDVVDPGIRSKETLKKVSASGSAASRRWKIVSSLQPGDFAKSLRATHVEALRTF